MRRAWLFKEETVQKLIWCLLACGGLVPPCFAQIKWVTWLPGDTSYGLYIAADKLGNSSVAGKFYGTVSVGKHVLTSAGDSDIFLAVLKKNGAVSSAISIGGPGEDFPTAIAFNPAGEVFVAGRVGAGARFFNGDVSATNTAFVIKMGHEGHLQWARLLEDTDATVKFLSTERPRTELWMSGLSSNTVFTAAWDRKGKEKYRSATPLPPEPVFTALTLDRSHNVLLTGSLMGTAVFGDAVLEGRLVEPNVRHFVAKLSASGRWEWAQWGIQWGSVYPAAIVATADGSAVTTGSVALPYYYLFVTRHSSSGELVQADTKGEYRGYYAGLAIAVDRSNQIYVAGHAVEYALDPNRRFSALVLGPGEYRIKSRLLADANYARGICVDQKSRVYVTGDFAGEASFGTNVLGSGGRHAFIMRIDDAVRSNK